MPPNTICDTAPVRVQAKTSVRSEIILYGKRERSGVRQRGVCGMWYVVPVCRYVLCGRRRIITGVHVL